MAKKARVPKTVRVGSYTFRKDDFEVIVENCPRKDLKKFEGREMKKKRKFRFSKILECWRVSLGKKDPILFGYIVRQPRSWQVFTESSPSLLCTLGNFYDICFRVMKEKVLELRKERKEKPRLVRIWVSI